MTVLDQADGVGAGASGLPAGLVAPHVSADDNVLSRITRAGVQATLQRARALLHSGTDWAQTGVLEHNLAGKRKLPKSHLAQEVAPNPVHENGPCHPIDMTQLASPAQIAAAGLPPDTPALWHGLAGWVRPRQLVAAQLRTPGIQMRWAHEVHAIARHDGMWAVMDSQGCVLAQAPVLVVAGAYDSLNLLQPLPGFAVPLNPLRGQVSFGRMANLTEAQRQLLPPFPVNGHGSFISGVPTHDADDELGWFIGSTFERQCKQAPVRLEDHAANHQRLATLLPKLGEAMAGQFEPDRVHGWAGLRCTLPNRLPAVGPIDRQNLPGLWISAGMGARGISLAVLCGELAAAELANETLPLPANLAKHLAAERFNR